MNLDVLSIWSTELMTTVSGSIVTQLALLRGSPLAIDWGLVSFVSLVSLGGLWWGSDRRANRLKQQCQSLEQSLQHTLTQLQRSELRFCSLVQQAPFAVMRFAPDGSPLQVNSAWETMWEATPAATNDYNLLHDPQLQEMGYLPAIASAFAGATVTLPAVFYNPAINQRPGRSRWAKSFLYPVKDEAGTVQEVVLIQEDITPHKQSEVLTKLDHERFRRAVLDAPMPTMLHAEDGEVVLINHTWTELTGYTLAEIPTIAAWTEKACGDSKDEARSDISQLYGLEQRSAEGEHAVITRTGAVRIWDFHSAPLGTLPDGRRLVISTAFDLTERRIIEDSLQESEERLRLVLEAADCGTWYYDFATEKIIWSERCRSMFGLTSSDLLDHGLPSDERERINQAISSAIADRTPLRVEHPIIWQDGSVRWLAAKGCAFYRDNGEPMRMLGIAVDITEAKRDEAVRQQAEAALIQAKSTLELKVAERTAELIQVNDRLQAELFATQVAEIALQESETRYRSVVNVLAEGITLQDDRGAILTCNASAERILGLSIDQMAGRTSLDPTWQTIHEDGSDFPGEHHPAMVSLQTGKACLGIIMGVHRPDGGLTWISINSQPLFEDSAPLPHAVVTSFTDVTNLKQAEDSLRESEAELRALFAAMTDVVLVRDAAGRCLKIAPTSPKNLYRPAEEMLGKTLQETFPALQAEAIQQWVTQALREQQPIQGEYSLPIQGQDVWFSAVFSPISPDAIVLIATDITDRKQAEAALFQEKELAQVTLRSISDAVITTDEQGRVQYLNPIAETLIGWARAEAQGIPIGEVFHVIHEISRNPLPSPIEAALREGRTVEMSNDTVLVARDGTETAINDSAAPIRNREGAVIGAVMVFRDVSQARSLTKQLSWQARHDPLTGLPNRREFESCLERAVILAQTQAQSHALGYLDLDRFKMINDTCGHAAGDELLCQITTLFQAHLRKSDTLARLGGDEFAILLYQCSLTKAQAIANVLREQVHAFRFVWQQQQFTIGVSIGLVSIDAQSQDATSVLKAADAACYGAKNQGRNRVYVRETNS